MTTIIELHQIEINLAEAKADLALLQRLLASEDRVKQLSADYNKAVASNERAEAAKAKAAHEAKFAGLRDLAITEIHDSKSPGVLSNRFQISYTRDAWDSAAGVTLPQAVSRTGFGNLEANVLAWIVERHPEKVPASIMALGPDINAAFGRYFLAMQRGYLAS